MVPSIGHPTGLLVRSLHVVGMALLLGGALLAWGVLRSGDGTDPGLRIAAAYERLFWGGAGLLVMTGVGNLGSIAPAIPGPGTAWGATLALKLVAAVGLFVGSVPRTLAVARWLAAPEGVPTTPERLRRGYAATALYLLVVVALAEVLAHG